MSDPTTPGTPVPPPPGGPVTPPPSGYVPPAPSAGMPTAPQNGMGVAALVMGILQFFCLPFIASVLAIIFGKIGMNKAKRGEATNGGVAKAGFWLGIIGLILSVIGAIILVITGVFVTKAVVDSIDPARNSQTGLADGTYVMAPNTSLRIGEESCSFGGPVADASGQSMGVNVTVVGQSLTQCAGTGTPDAVLFTVSGGVAAINAVQ